jgi:uncharacterized protein (DUF983 family)
MMLRILSTIWDTGLRLRCPVCEQGALFRSLFSMNKTCPHCSVRFERFQGEEVGGMTISIVATTTIFLVGYFIAELRTDWSVWVHLGIWVPFAIIFPIVFYRYSRSLWIVFLYSTNSIYWDSSAYQDTNLSIVDAFFNRQPPDGATGAADAATDDPDSDKLLF